MPLFRHHENTNAEHDAEFLSKLNSIVLQKLSEDGFGVNALAKEVRLSRSQLHRKLKFMTGKSASCFIRETRLLHASELLRNNNNTISEIAYKVGFKSPSYFNKCFHDYFGHSPGVYKYLSKSDSFPKQDTHFGKNIKPRYNSNHKYLRYLGLLLIAIILLILVLNRLGRL